SRMFAYGLLSVVLVLYLVEVGLKKWEIGVLLSLTLAGDTVISLWLTTTADRLGRRRTLIAGAILMVLAGIVFVSTGNLLSAVGVRPPRMEACRLLEVVSHAPPRNPRIELLTAISFHSY